MPIRLKGELDPMGLQAFHEVPSVAAMNQEAMHVAAGLLVCLNGLVERDGHALTPVGKSTLISLNHGPLPAIASERPLPFWRTRPDA